MEIQYRLLMEQIEFLGKSEIGRKLFNGETPASVDEFRKRVPLTTYTEYALYLNEQKSVTLPAEPYAWARTSGRSGEYPAKWAPYTRRIYDSLGEVAIAAMILASCTRKGEVLLEPKEQADVILLGTAPPPYTSGLLTRALLEQLSPKFVPSLDEGEKMDFNTRIAAGFELAMETGMDFFYGIASVLARIGERFESGSGNTKISLRMLRPDVLFRLIKGALTAKWNKRKMLPRDIWKLKGIMSGGTDTDIYRQRIKYYWGKEPLEGYACTEGGTMAMQSWNFAGMTFFPYTNFLEFIPYDEYLKNKRDPAHKPRTMLYHELQPGIYELVFTNFLGGVFTRYRVGDLFEVISVRDEELGIQLPQVRFYSRADGILDLAGFARFTEKSIWQVIEAAQVNYADWTARKEEVAGEPVLHLYIELKQQPKQEPVDLINLIRNGLKQVSSDFTDLEYMLGGDHLMVTQLPAGSFSRYMQEQQKAGADLAHIKPPHMHCSNETIRRLLRSA